MTKILGGAGGGGTPTIVSDSLRSQDSIEFIMGICEGPIAGLIDGPKSFYLNDTSLTSEAGDSNFEAFELHMYHGDADATRIVPKFGGVSTNVQVGVQLAQYVPVPRTTPQSLRGQIDRLELRLVINQLLKTNDDGDQLEHTARFKVLYKRADEATWRPFAGDASALNLKITKYVQSPHDGLTSTSSEKTNISFSGDVNDLDSAAINITTVTGSTTGSWTVAGVTYNRQVVGTYGTFYYNTNTNQYNYTKGANFDTAPHGIADTFNLSETRYALVFEVYSSGSGVVEVTGKTGSSYVKEYVRRIPAADSDYLGDWNISVEKLNEENNDDLFVTATFESYQCVQTDVKLKFNNLACIRGLGAASNQFASIPTFSGVYAGKLIKIPSNYNPITRVYSGTWNGTFQLGYSDNPAWCLYDMIMDENYGWKAFYPEIAADRWSFYEAAQWCDVLVPRTGATGYQPRYTYHDLIDQPRGGVEAAQYVASIFGGIITTDLNGSVRLKLDKPGNPVQIFGPESVTIEGFQYQFTDIASRANDFLVTFINPELKWNQDVRQVKVDSYIAKNGRIPMDFVAVGCIDPFEAQRRALLRLISANTEVTTVTFSTTRPGILLEPFDIIGITDPYMNWGLSGRIKSLGRDGVSIGLPSTFSDRANWSNNVVGNPRGNLATFCVSTTDTDGSDIIRVTAPIASNAYIAPKQSFTSTDGRKYRVRVVMRHNGAFAGGSGAAGRLSWRNVSADGTTNTIISTSTLTFSAPNTWQTFDLTVTDQASYINLTPLLYIQSTSFGTAGPSIDVKSFTVEDVTDEIHLRDSLFLTPNATYTLTVQSNDGPVDVTVQNVGGNVSTKLLVTSGTLPALPTSAQFALTSSTVGLVKPFRVLSIAENDGNDDLFTITAIEINVNKYADADELDISPEPSQRYSFERTLRPPAPVNITCESGTNQLFVTTDGRVNSRIRVTWEHDPTAFVEEYLVFFKRLDRDDYTKMNVTGTEAYIANVHDGMTYQIYVRAKNSIGNLSPASAVVSHVVVGKTAPPKAPTTGTTTQMLADVRIDWDDVTDLDLDFYEIRVGGTSWGNATRIGTSKSSVFTHTNVSGGTITYRIKAVDTSGNYSTNALTLTHGVQAPGSVAVSSSVTEGLLNLSWTIPASTLPIARYVVRDKTRGIVLDNDLKATTYSIPITWTGAREFEVWAVNSAGLAGNAGSISLTVTAPTVINLQSKLVKSQLTLSWTGVRATLPIKQYRVYLGESYMDALMFSVGIPAEFPENAVLLAIVDAQTWSMPVEWNGYRVFAVAAEDINGIVGPMMQIVERVDAPPAVAVTHSIVDKSVRLTWDEPVSELRIREYEVWRDGSLVQKVSATTALVPIDFSGTKTYSVRAIDEAGNAGEFGSTSPAVSAPGAMTLTSSIVGDQVRLSWTVPTSTLPVSEYILMRGASNTVITRVSANSYSLRADFSGIETFKIQAIDIAGNLSSIVTKSVEVVPPTAPVVKPEVLDNNVLLRWTNGSSTLPVATTEVRRGSTFATATVLQQVNATFAPFFEFQAGTYTYWIVNIDSAGNYGTPTSVTANVSQPQDFVLQADFASAFGGTKTNCYSGGGKLYFGVSSTETYEQHWTGVSNNTIQDQIADGYPYWLQPTTGLASSYRETFDYGTVLPSSIITITPTVEQSLGNAAVEIDIEVRKLATDAWTSLSVNNPQGFARDFRYVRFTVRVTGDSKDDLVVINKINVRLSAKTKADSGNGVANAADVGGTTVNFNTQFIDVDSISVTPLSTTARFAVYDFVDAPNPTSFKVLMYDLSGNRVSGNFSWTARGY